jgi:hypothetical protein
MPHRRVEDAHMPAMADRGRPERLRLGLANYGGRCRDLVGTVIALGVVVEALLFHDVVAEVDALVADVDGRAGDQLADLRLGLAAERAAQHPGLLLRLVSTSASGREQRVDLGKDRGATCGDWFSIS